MGQSQSQSKRKRRTKQKIINMIGCSKSHKHSKSCITACKNCGPNCHCGPNCNCPHKCPGNCYLNRRMTKGGSGCGSGSCPVGGLTGLRGGSKFIYTNNTPPGFPYNPGANPGWQAIEDTGYRMNGGFTYKRKHRNTKLRTTKNKTFKHYKYNGGGLFDEIKHNFAVATNAIRGVPAPPDPSPQNQPHLSSIRRL